MAGLSRHTGEPIDEAAHIRQSLQDILTTPVGSRVLNRGYGSRLHELVDRPLNAATQVDVFQATADAVAQWEPRVRVARVGVVAAEAGHLTIELHTVDREGTALDALEVAL